MFAILSEFVLVLLIFILSLATSVRAAEYEEIVSIPEDAGSSSTSGGNDSGYTTSTPTQGNTGNQNSNDQRRRSSGGALKDSAHKAGGTIIEAIGDAIGQSIRESFNKGSTPSAPQSNGQINSFAPSTPQPSQDNSQIRKKKKITDY